MGCTISLLNMKGGVGKTTLAVNLAWYIFERQASDVLLVDLDPQFNATQYVMDFEEFEAHRKKRGTIADLLIDQPRLSIKQKKARQDPSRSFYRVGEAPLAVFDLLPSELDLAWVVKNPAQMENCLEKLLEPFRSQYDYILVDCAPTDSMLTIMALNASDFVLVPMRPERFSILGLLNLQKTVKTFRDKCNNPHNVRQLGIVFTQVTEQSAVEADTMVMIRSLAAKHKQYVFSAALKYSSSFMRAVRDQTPIFKTVYARKGLKATTASIAKEMQKRIGELQGEPQLHRRTTDEARHPRDSR